MSHLLKIQNSLHECSPVDLFLNIARTLKNNQGYFDRFEGLTALIWAVKNFMVDKKMYDFEENRWNKF